MCLVKCGKIWRSFIGLTVCFCTLLVSIDCVGQDVGIRPATSFEEGDIGNLTIPFELPEQLYEGSYLQFPGSFAKKEFRYTPEGFMLVYFYRTKGAARKDMKSYAEKNHKISKEESSILAEHLGCIQEQEEGQLVTTWFTVSSYIIGVQVPRNKMARKELVKIGEEIISRYNERINRMFSTPEKCFETYLKAVDTRNINLIMECMYNDGSEKAKSSLLHLRMMIPYLGIIRPAEGVGKRKEDIKFGKAEIISDSEARLPIVSDPKTTRSSRDRARRGSCMGNLKQMGMGLHMFAMDHNEAFPEDISALYPKYIGPGVFKCTSDESVPKIKEIKPGTQISYVYVRELTEKDSPDSIVAYDASPDFHGGEGRNVLFLDGHVKWYAEEEFQKLLTKNRAE